MRQCSLKHKECPLKRQLVGRVIHSLEIQVAKATNRQKNGSAEESSSPLLISFRIQFHSRSVGKHEVSRKAKVYPRNKNILDGKSKEAGKITDDHLSSSSASHEIFAQSVGIMCIPGEDVRCR